MDQSTHNIKTQKTEEYIQNKANKILEEIEDLEKMKDLKSSYSLLRNTNKEKIHTKRNNLRNKIGRLALKLIIMEYGQYTSIKSEIQNLNDNIDLILKFVKNEHDYKINKFDSNHPIDLKLSEIFEKLQGTSTSLMNLDQLKLSIFRDMFTYFHLHFIHHYKESSMILFNEKMIESINYIKKNYKTYRCNEYKHRKNQDQRGIHHNMQIKYKNTIHNKRHSEGESRPNTSEYYKNCDNTQNSPCISKASKMAFMDINTKNEKGTSCAIKRKYETLTSSSDDSDSELNMMAAELESNFSNSVSSESRPSQFEQHSKKNITIDDAADELENFLSSKTSNQSKPHDKSSTLDQGSKNSKPIILSHAEIIRGLEENKLNQLNKLPDPNKNMKDVNFFDLFENVGKKV